MLRMDGVERICWATAAGLVASAGKSPDGGAHSGSNSGARAPLGRLVAINRETASGGARFINRRLSHATDSGMLSTIPVGGWVRGTIPVGGWVRGGKAAPAAARPAGPFPSVTAGPGAGEAEAGTEIAATAAPAVVASAWAVAAA